MLTDGSFELRIRESCVEKLTKFDSNLGLSLQLQLGVNCAERKGSITALHRQVQSVHGEPQKSGGKNLTRF